MGPMLSRSLFPCLFLLLAGFSLPAQSDVNEFKPNTIDYKDPAQFKDYNKRRKVLAYWQIQQFKKGALVVRLRNNRLLIDELLKSGRTELARQKVMEQYAMNKNTMLAYLDNFRFCNVYFMFSNSSDSLLNGVRSGLFLDTNLTIDPAIELKEDFYLIAERDYAYNSTIGFVKQDSARFVSEHGTAVRMMAVVLKNKFAHQLKSPFPYQIKEKNFMDANLDFPMTVVEDEKGLHITYTVNKTYFADLAADPNSRKAIKESGDLKVVHVKKQFTYEVLSQAVNQLNADLDRFYKRAPSVETDKLDPRFIPFLY